MLAPLGLFFAFRRIPPDISRYLLDLLFHDGYCLGGSPGKAAASIGQLVPQHFQVGKPVRLDHFLSV